MSVTKSFLRTKKVLVSEGRCFIVRIVFYDKIPIASGFISYSIERKKFFNSEQFR